MKYMHLFGPVPSRRLGVSLGIDLVPHKTCTYDCIYCECGSTTDLTLERKEYVPTAEVLAEIDDFLSRSPVLDSITFAGSGEPTLHRDIGRIVGHVKARYPHYTVAILTNGCLFSEASVRKEVLGADRILPTLNAVSREVFAKIHRPHPGVDPHRIISGLSLLRQEFSGEIWLEVFIVPGVNTTDTELARLKEAIERIQADRVQLNTLDRPCAVAWVRAATRAERERVAAFFDSPKVEIIASARSRREVRSYSGTTQDAIVSTIERRPCTIADLSAMLGLHPSEVHKYLGALLKEGILEERCGDRGSFFKKKEN
ncbi:MAG: radical SAM protein [Methanomicrobiales archaeon]|nr:radical SAM protein [Methanomicrobiales archaeon]MDI6875925.1 radical SAM protein [Methanomicrobiales archaeon]